MADSSGSDRSGADERSENPADSGKSEAATPVVAPKKSFARRNWGKLTLATILGLPAATLAIWTAVAMTYTYSDGERAGYVMGLQNVGRDALHRHRQGFPLRQLQLHRAQRFDCAPGGQPQWQASCSTV
jgi:hypothetical protein